MQDNEYSDIKIPNKNCLCYKNTREEEKLLKYGVKLEYLEKKNTPISDMMQKYSDNQGNYGGIISNYIDSSYMINSKFPDFKISKNFGFEPLCFIFNQNLHNLIEDVNFNILKMRDNLFLNNTCKKYYGSSDPFVCALT